MVLMGMDLPLGAVQRQIASGIDIIVHLGRLRDKSRKVLEVSEILDYQDGEILVSPLYRFEETGEKEVRKIPVLKYYNVFHISQVEGVKPLEVPFREVEPIEEADKIITMYVNREHLDFKELPSNKAFYSPSCDRVVVPMKEQYENINEYYSTTFHELTHSTGHKSRLDRLETGAIASFGSETYSKEELVAEIGSASLMNMLGIETPQTFKNSTAYIQNWLQVLKNDNKFIVSASSRAEKAVNYILGE